MIHADFETRSIIDLTKTGAYVYAAHPTTDVNCLGWAIDDDEVNLWMPGDPFPADLKYAIKDGHLIAAWNAQFERLIWNNVFIKHGAPKLPIERFYCIAALSRARGYPGKLERAAQFAELDIGKDMEGHRLMMKLCKPRKIEDDGTIVWWDDPMEHYRQGEYCRRDVDVERAMYNSLIPFTDEELADYHLSEEINDRGVCVDLELCHAAVSGAAQEKLSSDDVITSLTNGAVTAHTQVQRIMEWVEKEWKPLVSLNKSDVYDALAEDDIPPHVADVLELRLENAKAAVSKFDAILRHQRFGVVYGGYIYRGAGQTGRFTSMGVQRHNLHRKTNLSAISILKRHGISGLRLAGDPVHMLAQMTRPVFVASEGTRFLIADFAQIEARVTAWLAGEQWLLDIFADINGDPYCAFGTTAFDRVITKADELERFVSKGCVLGLGFGGGEGALARTLKKENITLPLNQRKDLVKTYRDMNVQTKKLWKALSSAVLMAMYGPGTITPVGPITYLFDGQHLWCKLPSGRLMCYPYAKVVQDEWGDSVEYRRGNRNPKSGVMEWPVVRLWHGLLTENLAQAIAFDLLMGALRRLREWAVRLHTHDEIVAEVWEEEAQERLEEMLQIMCAGEEWSEGLPIAAEGMIEERYGKGKTRAKYLR
jgi:DNA polymerase